jgi:hypothetical protein
MRETVPRFLFWTPRILCVLFSLFLTIFALDVFQAGKPAGVIALELALHLVPTFLLLLILALSWRHELLGAIIFVGLGILYLATTWGRFHWSAYAVISGSLFLIGGLFFANWLAKRHSPPGQIPALQH